mmetsp:Transcript_22732/g.21925  ORF Transcript_22732/g.21925 Transcript_22732/m.21925 type:complete len:94 (+) Transcript_22732:637-918(+)
MEGVASDRQILIEALEEKLVKIFDKKIEQITESQQAELAQVKEDMKESFHQTLLKDILPKSKPEISKKNSDSIKEMQKLMDRNFFEIREKDTD